MFVPILKLSVFLGAISICTCDSPCVKSTSCYCQLASGPEIDLSSLGKKDGTARFTDVPDPNNSSTYSYNPCYPFTEDANACQNVAACQKTTSNQYFSLGSEDSAVFYINGSDLRINYTSIPRIFSVKLVCDIAEEGVLLSEGEFPLNFFSFTLRTKCACPNGCPREVLSDGSISTGSILVILLLVFTICYLLGGMVFQKIVKGATGTELFPNHDFWIDFPLLIRDGVIFTCNGCQSEASYDRI